MKNFLLIVFKSGTLKTFCIPQYDKIYLEAFFSRNQIVCCTYLIYDLKLNKYGEGYLDRYGRVKTGRKTTNENYKEKF